MSYRNPKYINQSVQGSFDKLQDQINSSVSQAKTVRKDQEIADKVQTNREIIAGANQGQQTIATNASHNTIGGEIAQSKVGEYFNDYPARAAELATQLAKNPKPDNYLELQAELENINSSPKTMEEMLTNGMDFLNMTDMSDIDPHQNQDILLASQVFNGKIGFTKANGFDFNFRKGKGGSMEMVFTGEGYIPPYPPDYTGEKDPTRLKKFGPEGYVMNSAGMSNMQKQTPPQSLIVSTPKMSKQINSTLSDSVIFGDGAKFDKNGAYLGGGKLLSNVIDKNNIITETRDDADGNPRDYKFYGINRSNVEKSLKPAIDEQIASFMDPDYGNDGQARSIWNMRIAKNVAAVNFDENLAREAFGLSPDTEITQAHKDKWSAATKAWNYEDALTDEQRQVFNVMYKKFIVDDIVKTMESESMISQRQAGGKDALVTNLNNNG